MQAPSPEQIQRIKDLFEKYYNRVLTDAEIIECHKSLHYYAKAKHRYLLLKQGLLSPSKNDTVSPMVIREGVSPRSPVQKCMKK
jgi:hypothetical protein